MKSIAIFNPHVFYLVDSLRGSLIVGIDTFNSPLLNLLIVSLICVIMIGVGIYQFSKMNT
jgi:hypothetical protein